MPHGLTLYKLLDDLDFASRFTKVDLAQGFHQIHMAPDDIPTIVFHTHKSQGES